jgi:antirestriction protein ArdC
METVKRDHYAEVTGKIIASLEQGIVPWHQPWGFIEPAQNHFSGHRYRGINALLMLLGDFKTPYFATINQINEAGGKVKKGSKGTQVYFHDRIYKDRNGKRLKEEEARPRIKAGDKSISVYPFVRLFPVFNMADVEGCPVKPASTIHNGNNEPIPVCQDFVAGLSGSARIIDHPTEDAYFEKIQDFVMMPEITRFESSAFYYSVLFHELTHNAAPKFMPHQIGLRVI